MTVARPPSAQRLPWLLTPPRVGEQTPADLDTPFTVQAGLVVVTGTITFTLLGGTFLTLRARLTFRMRVTLGPILTRRTVLCRTRSLRRTRLPITLGTRTIAFAWRTLGTTALARRPLAPRLDGGLVTHAGDRLHRAGLTPRTIPPALALRPLCTLRRTALGCNTF